MKIKVEEFTGEVGKIPEYLNFEFSINSGDPGFKERFFKEREKALKKHLEERIKQNEIIKAKHFNREKGRDRPS